MISKNKKRLGDIINFKRGYDLPSYNRIEGPYPIVSSGGISGYHSEYKAEGEGLITGRYGTLGEMYYINGKYWPHNTALYVTDFKGNYPKYVYYLMKCLGNLKTSDKSTVPGINRNDLHEIIVPYIKPRFQQPIADCLFLIDSKIELNNRINTELEAMAKTFYDYWFVQFDFPDANGKPYKTNGGKMVWNKELQREIPENWKVDILENHISIERGISYKGTDIQAYGTPMVNLNSFYLDGRYKDDGIKYFVGTVNENKVIHSGDLMIATTDVTRNAYIIGKSFILPDLYQGQVVASCDIAKVNVGSKLDKYFLDMLFNSDNYHRYIKGFASGTLVLHLNTKGIDWYNCLIPPKDLLNKYATFKAKIDKKKSLTLKENQQLSSLRDWLLPMLMNGQVKVKDTVEETLLIAAEEKVKYHS